MGIFDGPTPTAAAAAGLGPVVLVLLAVALLGPAVAAAAAGLLRVLIIVAGVTVGVGATSLVAPTPVAVAPTGRGPRRPARPQSPVPAPRSGAGRYAAPSFAAHDQHPAEVHQHLHGVTGEDIAAILAPGDSAGTAVNRPGRSRVP